MRKALILLFMLFAVGLTGVIFMSRDIGSMTDKPVFSEIYSVGDPGAAKAVNVVSRYQYNDHLLWTSTADFDRTGVTFDTEFELCTDNIYEVYGKDRTPHSAIYFSPLAYGQYFGNSSRSWDTSEKMPFKNILSEMADQTEPNSETRKTVRLADYMEYYPMTAHILFHNVNINTAYNDITGWNPFDMSDDQNRIWNEYFRIPILEDEYCELAVEKDASGNIYSTKIDMSETGDQFTPETYYVFTDKLCYFCLTGETRLEKRADLSKISGGYGIYAFPLETAFSDKGQPYTVGYPENVFTLCTLELQDTVVHLSLSSTGNRLYAHLINNGDYAIAVIDAQSGEELQRLKIASETTQDTLAIKDHEGYSIIFVNDTVYVLSENEDGTLNIAIRADVSGDEAAREKNYIRFLSGNSFAFDGKRLIRCSEMLSGYSEPDDPHNTCGFSIAVYDTDGLSYFGEFESTLTTVHELTGAFEPNTFSTAVTVDY